MSRLHGEGGEGIISKMQMSAPSNRLVFYRYLFHIGHADARHVSQYLRYVLGWFPVGATSRHRRGGGLELTDCKDTASTIISFMHPALLHGDGCCSLLHLN